MICPDCRHAHRGKRVRCEKCREKHNAHNRVWYLTHGQQYNRMDGILDGREYEADEVEFMMAVERYKREKRRPFPTSHEILAVAKSLGYRKVADESQRTRETRRAEPRKRSLETTCRDAS